MKPIFISGYNKSGTTLFLSLLDAHQQLCVFPEELHYFNTVLNSRNRLVDILTKTGVRMLIDSSANEGWSKGKSWFRQGYPEFNGVLFKKLLQQLNTSTASIGNLLSDVMDAFAVADGLDRTRIKYWVTKTTQNELYVPLLAKCYSNDLHYFHIVRDPRDVYLSISKRNAVLSNDESRSVTSIVKFCSSWSIGFQELIRLKRKYPWIHIVKYEDIVASTDSVMELTAKILGIDYSCSMLHPTRHGNFWGGNSVFTKDSGDKDEITKSSVARYRNYLSEKEVATIEYMCKDYMRYCGYCFDNDMDEITARIKYKYKIHGYNLYQHIYYNTRRYKKYYYFYKNKYMQ